MLHQGNDMLHSLKNLAQKALIIFAFIGTFFLPTLPISRGTVAEIGSAIISIPLDIAAHSHDLEKSKKKAAFYHGLAYACSFLNKSLFLCNYTSAENKKINMNRELAANSTLAIYDIIKLFMCIKTCMQTKDRDTLDMLRHIESQQIPRNSVLKDIWTKLKQAGYVIVTLKGLSACWLAYQQVNRFGCIDQQNSIIATALNTTLTICDEFIQLEDPCSAHGITVFSALMASFGWLIYEAAKTYTPPSRPLTIKASIRADELENSLHTKTGGITSVRGNYLFDTEESIRKREREMETILSEKGVQFIRADGYFRQANGRMGHLPNSYIIFGINEEDMIKLAQRFKQNSVITFNGDAAKLLCLHGQNKDHYFKANSWRKIDKTENIDCSSVETTNGPFTFTYNFNFSENTCLQ